MGGRGSIWKKRSAVTRLTGTDGKPIDLVDTPLTYNATQRIRDATESKKKAHPGSDGKLGGTFSVGEINNYILFGQGVYSVTAPEGIYSFEETPKFDANGLQEYYRKASKTARIKYENAANLAHLDYMEARTAYADGEITKAQLESARRKAKAAERKAYNTMLVEQHNALRAGQRKYGYSYSLEKRRS